MLKPDAAIEAAANEALKARLGDILELGKQYQRGVRNEEISTLSAIIDEFPRTAASIRAQFLIGNAYLNEGRPEDVENGKRYFEVLIQNGSNTVEAALAKVQLEILVLRCVKDPALRQKQVASIQEAITNAYPFTRQCDEDKSDVAVLFKKRTLGSSKDRFTPRLKLDLSAMHYYEGNATEAKRILLEIISEYHDSVWSDKAERRLKSINNEERKTSETLEQ